MLRKLTINVADDVYEALHKLVGQGNISQFVENLVRPHLVPFKRITAAQGRGAARYTGKPATDADMRRAAGAAAARRWTTRQR